MVVGQVVVPPAGKAAQAAEQLEEQGLRLRLGQAQATAAAAALQRLAEQEEQAALQLATAKLATRTGFTSAATVAMPQQRATPAVVLLAVQVMPLTKEVMAAIRSVRMGVAVVVVLDFTAAAVVKGAAVLDRGWAAAVVVGRIASAR